MSGHISEIEEAYFAALDEICRLRNALAYEASVLAIHLDYKSFPKSRRGVAIGQVERMRSAACGAGAVAYAGVSYLSLRWAMSTAGAPQTLTRSQWEASLPRRGR